MDDAANRAQAEERRVKRRLRRAAGGLLRFTIRLAARLFVRGSRLSDATSACRRFAARGRASSIGYFNAESETPRAVADACLAALEAIARGAPAATAATAVTAATVATAATAATGLPYLSIKAPALSFDPELVGAIVDRAASLGVGVHFDSHAADQADPTFDAIATALRRLPGTGRTEAGQAQVIRTEAWKIGCTLPGRWPRSLEDAQRAIERGLRVRLVKGQWADPTAPAVDLRQGFLAVVDRLAGRARQVAVATHDAPLAREALRRLQRAGTPAELELLLGLPTHGALRVARELRAPVRIYIPFGVSWLPYALRHVQKNPRLAWWAVHDATIGRFVAPPQLTY
jgi:proline dehydrogenase